MLVRFDIGAFRGMSLSEEALEYADEILKCFHSRGKEIILRVLYDTQGKGNGTGTDIVLHCFNSYEAAWSCCACI